MARQPRKVETSTSFIVVALFVCAVGAVVVVREYTGQTFWPEFVAGFAASLFAFMLALAWERDRERRRFEQDAADLEQRLTTEVRRRFEPVWTELEKNQVSLEFLDAAFRVPAPPGANFRLLHPQLLEGAWVANAPRLAELVADYKLIGDLATTYGRIEELRWRLRYRTEHLSVALDDMVAPLVTELLGEVNDLLEQVRSQINQPAMQRLGLAHRVSATVATAVGVRGTVTTEVIRDSGGAKSSSAISPDDGP